MRNARLVIAGFLLSACFYTLANPVSAAAATSYYVATNGSDSNTGTISKPFLTLGHGFFALQAGDTLFIRGGTYDGTIGCYYGQGCSHGTSWSNALTIQAYPGELVTIFSTGQDSSFGFGTDSYPTRRSMYVILKDVIIDGSKGSALSTCVSGNAVDYVRLQNVECRNAGGDGIIPHGRFWEFLNVNSHDNGQDTSPSHARGHGIYLTDGNCLIDGGAFHHNGGYGIQIYDNGSNSNDNNIVRNARIYKNNLNTGANPLDGNGGGGMVLANGMNNTAYNNIFYGNGAISIQINSSCRSCTVYNNTEYGGQIGLSVFTFALNTVAKNNILVGNQIYSINDTGTGTVLSNNMTLDPFFVDASKGNFRVQASSPAIDAGVDLHTLFATDITGAPRPVGTAFDIGAYEYGSSPATDPISPTVSITVTQNQH